MATPAFFDYEVYMTNKLAQVQNAEPTAGWTMTKLMEVFAENGFVGAEGAYAHFTQFGAAEEVAPNASFNANEYYAAKAAQFYGVEPKNVTEFQIANVKQIITSNGMNAWTHYQQFGSAEGVNPSNAFDADAYLAAKAVAMGDGWTAAKIADAIKANGMTVLDHYLTYAGKGEGEVAKDATFPVPDDKKVPSNNPGQTYNLTKEIDSFTGMAGDDKFVGSAETTQAADQIDGGAGDDTFTFVGANKTDAATLVLPTMTSIENLVFSQNDSKTIDASAIAGLKTVTLDKHDLANASEITLAGQTVTVKAPVLADNDKLSFKGDDTALKLTVDGVKAATGVTAPTIDAAGTKMATMDLTALNNDSTFTLAGTALKTLNIKGDAKVDVTTAVALETIDASANSAGVKIDMSTASANKDLTFTGTAAADEIIFNAAHLTKTDVLDGGAGRDILTVNDTDMNYDGINAAKNFEVLNLGKTDATVDVAKISNGINEFGLDGTVANSAKFTNALSTSKFFVNVEGDQDTVQQLTITNKIGDTSATTVTFTNNSVAATTADVIKADAINTLNLASEGKFANSVEVDLLNTGTVKLTGSADMTLARVAEGTKDDITIDATAFTGKLTYTGGDGVDLVKVGANGSLITASKGLDQITFGAGVDKYNASSVTFFDKDNMVTIAEIGAKDIIKFAASSTWNANTAKIEVSSSDTFDTLLAKADDTVNAITYFAWDGDTYLVRAGATVDAHTDDVIIKLAGTVDLSTATFAGQDLTIN